MAKIRAPHHNYEAAYRRKNKGDLKWVSCFANTSKEADKIMDDYVSRKHGSEFRRYAGALLIKK